MKDASDIERESRFRSLRTVDLKIDEVYLGGSANNVSDDPIAMLLPVGNSGGIRFKGPRTNPALITLLTSGDDIDWPDTFDAETGRLLYFGDNKKAGRDLHETPRGGNVVLRNLFDAAQGGVTGRKRVPPIFVFSRNGPGRSYRYLGLAVPGGSGSTYKDELVGVWRSRGGLRFQNYQAAFTVLDVAVVKRQWIDDVLVGKELSDHAPPPWLAWKRGSPPKALTASRTRDYRTRIEQEPLTTTGKEMVATIYQHFAERPHAFESFAADLVRAHLPSVTALDVTRRSRDGGRDAIGQYRLGSGPEGVHLDFSMEAKCYKPGSGVGVRELSRLISRLRHRQFGVLVTTSHLDSQAYRELKEDGHPIVVIAAREIAQILLDASLVNLGDLASWLASSYPVFVPEETH